jgi:hypothetical protein
MRHRPTRRKRKRTGYESWSFFRSGSTCSPSGHWSERTTLAKGFESASSDRIRGHPVQHATRSTGAR